MAMQRRTMGRSTVLILVAGMLLGAAFTAAAAKPLDPGSSPDQRLVEYRVDIPAGDHMIPAILAVPKAGGPNAEHPGVLMVHGFASYKDEVGEMYKREARYLAVAGYASLRIDFAGSGESTQPWTDNNFDGMVADTRTALDWFIDHEATDSSRIQPRVTDRCLGGRYRRSYRCVCKLVGSRTERHRRLGVLLRDLLRRSAGKWLRCGRSGVDGNRVECRMV